MSNNCGNIHDFAAEAPDWPLLGKPCCGENAGDCPQWAERACQRRPQHRLWFQINVQSPLQSVKRYGGSLRQLRFIDEGTRVCGLFQWRLWAGCSSLVAQ